MIKALACAVLVASCGPLDTEQTIKAKATQWLFVSEVFHVLSERDCTAAALRLGADHLRYSGAVQVRDVRSSLPHLEAGRSVAFVVPGTTPYQVSEQLMSMRLFEGLGMLGSFLGPSKRCMDDPMVLSAHTLLSTPEAVLIYDPVAYVIVLADKSRKQGVFLRIKG